MSKKQEFIKYIKELIEKTNIPMSDEVSVYWEAFQSETGEVNKPAFTDSGKLILQYMQDNLDTSMLKARDIAEGLFISSKKVSGAMRKLVTDGYVEKVGQNPTIYMITEKGKTVQLKETEEN